MPDIFVGQRAAPNVIGLDPANVFSLVDAAGLLPIEGTPQVSPSTALGLVANQFPAPGTLMEAGDTLFYYLSISGGLYVGTAGLGGGGSIYYQGPRAPRTMGDSPNRDAERIASLSETEAAYDKLTGPTASPKMQQEVIHLAAPFEDEDGDIDYAAWNADADARKALMAVLKRYSEKRASMFQKLRADDYDWDPNG